MKITLEQIIDLAKEATDGDDIPWQLVNLDEEYSWEIIATQVYDAYLKLAEVTERDAREVVFLALVTSLTMRNFVLNAKLGLMD
jgi:hypothetical protein